MTSEMLLADKYLHVINDRGKRRLPLQRVYRNIRRKGMFLKAYAKLYANDGSTTAGSDPNDTIQGMSLKRIEAIIQQLENGSYKWKPADRKYVPKADGQKRPISIPSWNDKMVQEVMRMVLEAYYEPRFRDSSHGFRPNRGCLTALESIQKKWTGVTWFIEGDIKGCFDNIPHETILEILGRDIQDNRFLKLAKGILKAGFVEDWVYQQTHSGTPQGGVISPLLSNIVLHELDKWIEDELIPKYTKGTGKERNPEYKKLLNKRQNAKRRALRRESRGVSREITKADWQEYTELGRELREIPSRVTHDTGFRRLRYVRYADDFLLGFIGSHQEALAIKQEISEFLATLGLEVSQKKTLITNAKRDKARFLGYELSISIDDKKVTKYQTDGRKRRSVNGKIKLHVPADVITKWCRKYTKKGKPHQRGYVLDRSDFDIVNIFGQEIRGLQQYYALAIGGVNGLRKVRYYCMESLVCTLASKHKCKKTDIYKKYKRKGQGGEQTHIAVVIEREGRRSLIAKCGEKSLKRIKPDYLVDNIVSPYAVQSTRSELVDRLLKEECELCGKKGPLEGHHVRKLADLKRRWQGRKAKPDWVKEMIARRRKTLFICPECHKQITLGKYDGKRIR